MTMSMTHDLLLLLLLTSTFILALLLPSSPCLQDLPFSAPQGMLMEDKIRLGSIPPNCRNRCNECNPCEPVQVPTLPTGSAPVPGQTRAETRTRTWTRTRPLGVERAEFNQYSNYKPLGWKCRCGNRLFNP